MSIHSPTRPRTYAVSLIAALALTGGLLTGCSATTPDDHEPAAAAHPAMVMDSTESSAQIALYSAMRTLWGEHMQWTYDTVVAFASGSDGLDAVPVLVAAKAGDSAALDTAVADWYANAEEIGDFLATANPNWGQADMRDMMKMHITQTIGYASDVVTGDYAKAITDYDAAQSHMVEMADMLSSGIIAQFPDRF